MPVGELIATDRRRTRMRATSVARNTSPALRLAAVLIASLCCGGVVAEANSRSTVPASGRLAVAAITQIGNRGADFASALAPSPDGGVVIGTHFNGTLGVAGGTSFTARGGGDIALFAFDRALALRWSRHFGGTAHDELRALDFGGRELAAAGFFVGESGFVDEAATQRATTQRVTTQGGADGFVGFLDGRGTPVGLQRMGGKESDLVRTLASLPDGELLVGGHFQAASRLAPGTPGVRIGAGGTDVFVQRLNAQRAVRWARTFGGAGDDELAAAAALPNGGALLLLRHDQPLQWVLAGESRTFAPRNGHDALLLWLDSDGNLTRTAAIASAGNDELHLLSVQDNGTVVLAGEFQGTQSWRVDAVPSIELRSRGSTDAVMIRLYPNGRLLDLRHFGSIGPDTADALASHGPDLWLALGWQGSLALDKGTTIETSDTSAVLLRLDGRGAVAERLVFEGEGVQKITAFAAQSGDVWVTGVFETSLSATGMASVLKPVGKSDVFVARVDAHPLD